MSEGARGKEGESGRGGRECVLMLGVNTYTVEQEMYLQTK